MTYWKGEGTFKTAINELQKLIPPVGSVDFPRSKNKHLEKLRKATNCYHDLYNNGLGNRNAEFRRVFDLPPSHFKQWDGYSPRLYELVEDKMDILVIRAAEEQGITIVADNPKHPDDLLTR